MEIHFTFTNRQYARYYCDECKRPGLNPHTKFTRLWNSDHRLADLCDDHLPEIVWDTVELYEQSTIGDVDVEAYRNTLYTSHKTLAAFTKQKI